MLSACGLQEAAERVDQPASAQLLKKIGLPASRGGLGVWSLRWQRGASAWLHASRKDPKQKLQNAYFRIAVGLLLSINCFSDISSETQCPCCHQIMGPTSLVIHAQCRSIRTGDNNRRHNLNAGQQALLWLLRLAGASVTTRPGVTASSGAQLVTVAPDHAARMLDLKAAVGLGDHDDIINISVWQSDCGTGKPAASHKSGSKSNRKGEPEEKRVR